MNSDWPDAPVLTDALLAQIHLDNIEEGEREKAFKTMFRYSDAGKCGRALGYKAIGVAESNPMDIAGEWVTWLGAMLHVHVQRALERRFPNCEVEVKSRHGDLTSGHGDALIAEVEGMGRVYYELKTRGSYGFNTAIGLDRKKYAQNHPQGPGAGAQIQGALGATAVDADFLIIGIIGMEAVSKQLANRLNYDDLSRLIAEWHYDRNTYAPWARDELDRLSTIRMQLEGPDMFFPARVCIDSEMAAEVLTPDGSKASWQCVYCSFRDRCIGDGPIFAGPPPILALS